MSNLKPCPFCGGDAHIQPEGDYHEIHCDGCGIELDRRTYDEAITAWNTRAETEADRIKEAGADRITQRNSLGRVVLKEEFLCERCNEGHWSLGEITDRLAYFEENKSEAEKKIEKAIARYREYSFDDWDGGYKHALEDIIRILEGGK